MRLDNNMATHKVLISTPDLSFSFAIIFLKIKYYSMLQTLYSMFEVKLHESKY